MADEETQLLEKGKAQFEDENKPSQKKEVSIPECTVHSVVVYPDRAEVTRLVKVQLNSGSAEVVLKKISKSLDKDSIRVDGIGPASVTEVSFQEIAVTQEEDDRENASAEVLELKGKIEEMTRRKEETKQQEDRLTAQIELMNKYSNGLFESGAEAITSDLLDHKTIDGVFGFLDTFEERRVRQRVDKEESHEETLSIQKELEKLNERLRELKPKAEKPAEPVKQQVIGILLDVKEEAEIQLLVSYVVSNAGWSPKYDLRVSSSERTMQVTYFGLVKQNTEEDWSNARLALSTATPSIGGSAPTLETLKLSILPNYYPTARGGGGGKKKSRLSGYGFGEEASSIEAAQAKVSEGLINSLFEISTLTNVPSDNSGHKVHIAQIDLKPTFEYDTVPKLAQHAFLRAKVVNNSNYPFLAGPSNVFLDNSYVTETTLNSVSPNEEFSCSLGVDSSVKVVYKPVSRFRVETGLISKTVVYKYTQVTEILNTRGEPAVITFTDQIPKSEDEKLKVTLVEPVIAKQKQGGPPPNPKLNPQNNLEWRLDLKPGETRSVTIHYTVEFPVSKKVEGL